MVKKLSSLKYSNFSKIFETVDNIEIGLLLLTISLRPDLGIGITFVCFNIKGKSSLS